MALKASNVKKDWVSTVIGILTLALPMLVYFGLISPQDQEELLAGFTTLLSSIAGLILVFARIFHKE